jgi:leucyl aminopeptidase
MLMKIEKTSRSPKNTNIAILAAQPNDLVTKLLTKDEMAYIKKQKEENKINTFSFNRLKSWVFVRFIDMDKADYNRLEECRKAGDTLQKELNSLKIESVQLQSAGTSGEELLCLAEGIALGNYQFIKYFKESAEKANSLNKISINDDRLSRDDINKLNILYDAVCHCRDMVNEPVMQLDALKLADNFVKMGKEAGLKVEVLNKKKIESLKMGGLLAVNLGSLAPPTFTIMEWKPKNATNEKPLILVGKGVVYDTGGLNIKTANYMENMKSDMGGAALMASVIFAVAKAKLPVHVIALMPATDNRLNGNAYVSGDVIKMHNGLTVEVINTDAEGRMILADALSYAQKYKPELVLDAATLTGSAVRAIGKYGLVAMHTKAGEAMLNLIDSGNKTYERVAEFPFWDEYADLIKSDIADLKNVGPPEAGMITAGKFLEKFTDYPFIHLDIAGVAFAEKRDSYRNAGGTGFGVRMLFDFIEHYGK